MFDDLGYFVGGLIKLGLAYAAAVTGAVVICLGLIVWLGLRIMRSGRW